MPLAGKPMVEWSLEAFQAAESARSIVVACPPGHAGRLQAASGSGADPGSGSSIGKRVVAVDGGKERADSVANALSAVDTELVAIHDAARPLVTAALIEGVVETLEGDPEAAGAIAATPVTDTIKRTERRDDQPQERRLLPDAPYGVQKTASVIQETLDRRVMWRAQTPQVFRTEALREAIAAAEDASAATDEAMLVEAAGGRVLIHAAPAENIKVTTPLDLRLAEVLLRERP